MSKKKKHKVKRPNPPLSALDKGIYIATMLLGLILGPCTLGWHIYLRELLAFSDGALASKVVSFPTALAFPMVFFIVIGGMLLFGLGFVGKVPIFGNKNVEYGVYPNPTGLYPLFDPRRKLKGKSSANLRKFYPCMAAFAICLALWAAGLAPRCSLYENGEVRHYSCFNTAIKVYSAEDFESVKFRTYTSYSWASSAVYYEMVLSRGPRQKCIFSRHDFYDSDESIDIMLSIKEMFPKTQVEYHGRERLDEITYLSEDDMAKLYRLFSS
ncbi:MAG: hypothetical protein IKV79_00795 [Oscillospiraceae bacterium]|nr:hypothetical protein [Oscillospiraceae bacterium]